MTQTTAVPTFGQAVGEAQTALRAVIVDVLQEAGTTFERWVALNTLATHGVAVARDELLRELGARGADGHGDDLDLLDRLARGLVGRADGGGARCQLAGRADRRRPSAPRGPARDCPTHERGAARWARCRRSRDHDRRAPCGHRTGRRLPGQRST